MEKALKIVMGANIACFCFCIAVILLADSSKAAACVATANTLLVIAAAARELLFNGKEGKDEGSGA